MLFVKGDCEVIVFLKIFFKGKNKFRNCNFRRAEKGRMVKKIAYASIKSLKIFISL
jgi:hypothetical protein